MPYSMRKLPGKKNCYRVTSKKNGRTRVHSKCTTLKKAKAQIRLLNAMDYGWVPTGTKSTGGWKKKKCHKCHTKRRD
jgi:hypothetical protein